MTYLTIQGIIFVTYVTWCLFLFNLTVSISITFYKHKESHKWIFRAFMVSFSFFLAMAAGGWMFWVAMFFAWITAIAADSRASKILEIAHIGGATLMIAFGAVGLGVHYGLWDIATVGAIGTGSLIFPQVRKRTSLIEIWWFIVISFGVYHAIKMDII